MRKQTNIIEQNVNELTNAKALILILLNNLPKTGDELYRAEHFIATPGTRAVTRGPVCPGWFNHRV